MANWHGYRAIRAKAREVGWPKHYKTDLTKHDRRILSRGTAPEEFVWVLRECGTHLLPANDWGVMPWALAVIGGEADSKTFVWQEGFLREVTPNEALTFLESRLMGRLVLHRRGRVLGEFAGFAKGAVMVVRPTSNDCYDEKAYSLNDVQWSD